jgi:hypothetical protein
MKVGDVVALQFVRDATVFVFVRYFQAGEKVSNLTLQA